MGWLYQRDPVGDPVAHLMGKFTWHGDNHLLQPLDGARVGNNVYLAVRSTDKTNGRTFVFAAVILISNTKKHGFGYKDMEEAMGPNPCDCPERIMRQLSPVADIPYPGHAPEWRARVAARHAEKRRRRQLWNALRVGSTVTLETAVRFPGGATASTFCVSYFRRKTPIFVSLDGPEFYCRLTAATLAAATIAEPPSEPRPAVAQGEA
jgi:hypothetical protein